MFKAHKGLALPNLRCRLNSLEDADGWAKPLDSVQNSPDYTVVINAARTKTSTASYGDIMKEALREMQRELTVFWIINRHRDSIELVPSFQEAFTDMPVHVCRNLYFGESDLPAGLRKPDALGRLLYRHRAALAAILHMPSGWPICGLSLAAGVFYGALAVKKFTEAEKGGRKGELHYFVRCSIRGYFPLLSRNLKVKIL